LTNNTKPAYWLLAPVLGSIVFAILYLTAASLYPGGSQADAHSKGFSWINNYWCNLLNEKAINSAPNTGRPFALAGMGVLCFTLAIFWFVFPKYASAGITWNRVIPVAGAGSMFTALFLFTSYHDAVTNIAGGLGLVALTGTYIGLYKSKLTGLLWFGAANLLLVILNNYVYRTRGLISYLPLIQKISFASFLIWICCICISFYRNYRAGD
jgi:hypothetical protein